MTSRFFPYQLEGVNAALLRLFGVRADRDGVTIDGDELTATFGFFTVRTTLGNIADASVTGPYQWIKAIGPRLSAADHGLTFGTTTDAGVCLRFVTPVKRVIGPWDHPGLTVTVQDPAHLRDAVSEAKP